MAQNGRADGRRNRELVLKAAETVFGEFGAGASTEMVAERAGVGIATVFRHFASKQALVEAVVMMRLDRLLETADAIVAGGDPGGLFVLFALFVEEGASKRVFGDILTGANRDYKAANGAIVAAFWERYTVLLVRGQQAGLVRADIDLQDIRGLLAGAHQALGLTGDDEGRRRKLVEVMTAGLHPMR